MNAFIMVVQLVIIKIKFPQAFHTCIQFGKDPGWLEKLLLMESYMAVNTLLLLSQKTAMDERRTDRKGKRRLVILRACI